MKLVARCVVTVAVGALVCILHAPLARSDELCAALDPQESTKPAEPPVSAGACPSDMVEIDADFCPFLDQICLRRPPERSYRCSLYAKSGKCQTQTRHLHYCIDLYEWPNKAGEMPTVMKDWHQAKAACEGVGKRLCTEDEWTKACEGPDVLPYPYGYARDSKACNIDKPHPDVDEKAINDPKRVDAEVARLWQGEVSGARERCVSGYGVHDMTGNVDEWTVNERGKPHKSALKGGYWSYARARCCAVTEGHEESFRYYQIGWRCCGDPRPGAPPPVVAKRETAPLPEPASSQAKAEPRETKPAFVSPPPPVVAKAPDETSGKGLIDVPARASGHRVFVDGRVASQEARAIVVDCGNHVVRVGHDGRDQSIDVPCGGRVAVDYP